MDRFEDIMGYAYFWTCELVTLNGTKIRSYMADCFCNLIMEVLTTKTSALSVRCVKERVVTPPTFQSLTLNLQGTSILATTVFKGGGSAIENYEYCIADNTLMTGAQCYNTNVPVY